MVVLIFFFWFFLNKVSPSEKPSESNIPTEYGLYKEEITALDQFITKHYLNNGLMQTNLKPIAQSELAGGEDLLSESVGLMLQYYLKTNQESAFEAHLYLANNLLLKDNGLYQWRFRSGQSTTVSASVDDLRIIKVLLLASKKWQRSDFEKQGQNLSVALWTHCVKEGKLLSYDGQDAEDAPLFYYDFKALKELSVLDDHWNIVVESGQRMLSKNRINGYPFYSVTSTERESYKMIENSLIGLYLSEVGQLSTQDLHWYKEKLKKGAIFAEYSSKNKPLSNIESPAIYGIVAQIAKNENDIELYKKACQKLKEMQYFENDSYYGGFYDPKSKDAFSFDQLMGLLGY